MESSVIVDRSQPMPGASSAPVSVARKRRRSRSAVFLIWLRRVHLYVGLWGAVLGLLFGATGILLNHRAILKIPVEKVVQRTAHLPLPDAARGVVTPEQMARWLQAELKFDGLHTRIKADPARTVIWADREVKQPERWTFTLYSPHRGVSAEYYVGNRFIRLDTQDATPIGTLTRLHMSVGVNAFWVLLSDTIAGGLIVLCVTGLLLWSRLHPIKLSAVGVSVAALLGGIGFLWTAL